MQDRIQKVTRNSKSEAYFALSFQMGKVSTLPILFIYFHFGMVSVFLFVFFLVKKKIGLYGKALPTQEGSI